MGENSGVNGESRDGQRADGIPGHVSGDSGNSTTNTADVSTNIEDVSMEDVDMDKAETKSGDQAEPREKTDQAESAAETESREKTGDSDEADKAGDSDKANVINNNDTTTTASSTDKPAESAESAESADPEEPPSKRQKVVDEDESAGTRAESKTDSADSANHVTETTDPVTESVSGDKANESVSDKSVLETPVKSSTNSASSGKSKSSGKKDGKISTFFSATPTKSNGATTATPSKKAASKSGNASSVSGTPVSGKTKPATGSSTATPTPLKLRLKTKPALPALVEDHDEENPNPEQIGYDSDSIENHPDIAFCVMFRTRFTDLFDGWCPPLCPQDFEAGIQPEEGFSHAVESYLVRVMSLMANRKKPVEVGKYSNALETWSTMPLAQGSVSAIDAMSLPCGWSRKLASRDVVAMDWRGRLQLLKMATVAALSLSDAVKKLIADKREVSGRKVLSELQWLPLGEDLARNTYWLADGSGDINWDENGKILPPTEGAFDTPWRLYRQTNPYKAVVSWQPVASSPEELATLIEEMPKTESIDKKLPYSALLVGQHEKLLSKLEELIPRTLGSRDRIREAEDRAVAQQQKKAAAARAHEYQKSKIGTNRGRTRGKRVDYKQLAAPQDSEEDEYELKEEGEAVAVAQGHRRTGRARNATVQEGAYDEDAEEFETTPSPEAEAEEVKPETPRNAEGKRVRYVEKQGGGRRGKGWVYVVEEEIE